MDIKSTKNLSDSHIEEIARIFGVLSEPSRLKLLRALMERSMTVSELMEATGMRQGNVSKHLGLLLVAGFVERASEGNFARYSLRDPTVIELCRLMCTRVEEHARQKLNELQ
jgi:DNA-binding transcriptional ArsR family regulator